MLIRRVRAHAFGPMAGDELEFADGLTVIYGRERVGEVELARRGLRGAVRSSARPRRAHRGGAQVRRTAPTVGRHGLGGQCRGAARRRAAGRTATGSRWSGRLPCQGPRPRSRLFGRDHERRHARRREVAGPGPDLVRGDRVRRAGAGAPRDGGSGRAAGASSAGGRDGGRGSHGRGRTGAHRRLPARPRRHRPVRQREATAPGRRSPAGGRTIGWRRPGNSGWSTRPGSSRCRGSARSRPRPTGRCASRRPRPRSRPTS